MKGFRNLLLRIWRCNSKITSENSNTFISDSQIYILERQGRIQCSEIYFENSLMVLLLYHGMLDFGFYVGCNNDSFWGLQNHLHFCIRRRILFGRHKENPKYSITLHQRAVRSQEFLISPSLLFLLHAYDKVYSISNSWWCDANTKHEMVATAWLHSKDVTLPSAPLSPDEPVQTLLGSPL